MTIVATPSKCVENPKGDATCCWYTDSKQGLYVGATVQTSTVENFKKWNGDAWHPFDFHLSQIILSNSDLWILRLFFNLSRETAAYPLSQDSKHLFLLHLQILPVLAATWSGANPAANHTWWQAISPGLGHSQNTLSRGGVQTVDQGFHKRHLFTSIFHYNYRVLKRAAKEVRSEDHGQIWSIHFSNSHYVTSGEQLKESYEVSEDKAVEFWKSLYQTHC